MSGINIACVQFNRAGKIFEFFYEDISLSVGDRVVVETERGLGLASVLTLGFRKSSEKSERKLKPIIRKALDKDFTNASGLTEDYVKKYTEKVVRNLKLEMRVLKGEVQFGGEKVVIYFSSLGRVDFRELVKSLAKGLSTRIELKQIGARDEAKVLGGIGICGREYCCSSFLREFVPVSIRMAKNQNLALNPHKVSGGCGRLLCCLNYENDNYTDLRKNLPPRGTSVRIASTSQVGKVIRSDLLNQTVQLETEAGEIETVKVIDIEYVNSKKDKEVNKSSELNWGDDLDLESLADYTKKKHKNNKTKK